MATERRLGGVRRLLIAASLVAIGAGGVTAVRWAGAAPTAPASSSPTPAAATWSGPTPVRTTRAPTRTAARLTEPGVPVAIDIPIASRHHPGGVHARIEAHGLNADRTLYVPADPTRVAWASDDARPGAARGTAILVSHVNYVIHGRTVAGAFADLAAYAAHAVGRMLTVHLADGRTLRYRITGGREYAKDDLAAHPQLRDVLYDQSHAFGTGTGRLVLVSCGGAFDPVTGEYADNVFVYALPVA